MHFRAREDRAISRCRIRIAATVSLALFLIFGLAFSSASQGSGWVLVLPPDEALEPGWVLSPKFTDPPIQKWVYMSAHDSASACEQAKKKAVEESIELFKLINESMGETTGLEQFAHPNFRRMFELIQLSLHARCLPYNLWWGDRK